jgi:hypothetical protein
MNQGSGTVDGQWSQFQNFSYIHQFQVRLIVIVIFFGIDEMAKSSYLMIYFGFSL